MFGEDMNFEQFCQLIWSNSIYYWDKYGFLDSQLTMTRIVLQTDEEESFSIKFMKIEF